MFYSLTSPLSRPPARCLTYPRQHTPVSGAQPKKGHVCRGIAGPAAHSAAHDEPMGEVDPVGLVELLEQLLRKLDDLDSFVKSQTRPLVLRPRELVYKGVQKMDFRSGVFRQGWKQKIASFLLPSVGGGGGGGVNFTSARRMLADLYRGVSWLAIDDSRAVTSGLHHRLCRQTSGGTAADTEAGLRALLDHFVRAVRSRKDFVARYGEDPAEWPERQSDYLGQPDAARSPAGGEGPREEENTGAEESEGEEIDSGGRFDGRVRACGGRDGRGGESDEVGGIYEGEDGLGRSPGGDDILECGGRGSVTGDENRGCGGGGCDDDDGDDSGRGELGARTRKAAKVSLSHTPSPSLPFSLPPSRPPSVSRSLPRSLPLPLPRSPPPLPPPLSLSLSRSLSEEYVDIKSSCI